MFSDTSSEIGGKSVTVDSVFESTNHNKYSSFDNASGDYNDNQGSYKLPYEMFSDITKSVIKKQEEYSRHQINTLKTKSLLRALEIIIEYDENYYIARSLDLPLYALGDDIFAAIQNIKDEIESVYYELLEDDNFSDEWINYKKFLNSIVLD
jgi:predicted RNase H-like HicB family nuclease